MQVDAIAVELRPRPMSEASDLGVRLVQVHARSIWATCLPVFVAVTLVCLSTVEIATWLPGVLLFWLKPWLDRSVLFVLSRAAFGQSTRWRDLWQARRAVWGGQLLSTLTLRRLSPWRSFTQPIHQLEGQRGAARRQRRSQLLRGQRGAAGGMHLVYANLEWVFIAGLLGFVVWCAPDTLRGELLQSFDFDGSVAASLCLTAIYGVVVAVLEPCYVAAGFAMYLNRRVQLEAWDIEQEFRRAF